MTVRMADTDHLCLLDTATGSQGSRRLPQLSGLLPSRLPARFRLPQGQGQGQGQVLAHSLSDSCLGEYVGREGEEERENTRVTSYHSQHHAPGYVIMKSSTKQWVHTPELLLKGHVAYNVKFLGECGVDQPKGTEVVKDAIRKMKFNKHLKRAEGQKPPKVQLIISVDGLGIQDPKSKATLHEYPLHRISYCADDKSDKKMFTFIAKAATTNDHFCYVFNCSDKTAEEITLTVGQAFDLAYKRFLEEGNTAAAGANGDVDYKKQCLLLQRKVNSLQFENDALKKRVCELEKLKDRSDLEEFMKNNQPVQQAPQQHSMVGRRLENLVFDDSTQVNGKSGSTAQSSTPVLSPPPPTTRHHRQLVSSVSSPVQSSPLTAAQPALRPPASSGDTFNPFSSPGPAGGVASSDPFGMGAFNPASQETPSSPALHTAANGSTDFGASSHQELMDIQAGFSRGLSFGTDDFNVDDLDPLSHRL